jgi:hypothetical protein
MVRVCVFKIGSCWRVFVSCEHYFVTMATEQREPLRIQQIVRDAIEQLLQVVFL